MDASAHWQHFGHCTSTIIYWQSIGQILGNVPSLWTMAAPIHQVHFGQCMVASFSGHVYVCQDHRLYFGQCMVTSFTGHVLDNVRQHLATGNMLDNIRLHLLYASATFCIMFGMTASSQWLHFGQCVAARINSYPASCSRYGCTDSLAIFWTMRSGKY